MVLTKAFESADETIKKIKGSPELIRAFKALQNGGLSIEAGGEVIDIETAVQKTGSENETDSSE